MAREIRMINALRVLNGSLDFPMVGKTEQQITQTTAGGGGPGTVSIATAGEDIVITDITAVGICRITNLDPTNYVTVGPKITVGAVYHPFLKIKPGESYNIRLNPAIIPSTHTFHMQANVAAVKVLIQLFDD